MRNAANDYQQSLVASMIVQDGEEKTLEVLEGWTRNAEIYANDIELIEAMGAGACDVGIANHYYLARAIDEDPDLPVDLIWANQGPGEGGTHVNVSGGGVTKYAKHPALARQFLEWLGTEGQSVLVDSNFEFPANQDVGPTPLLVEGVRHRLRRVSSSTPPRSAASTRRPSSSWTRPGSADPRLEVGRSSRPTGRRPADRPRRRRRGRRRRRPGSGPGRSPRSRRRWWRRPSSTRNQMPASPVRVGRGAVDHERLVVLGPPLLLDQQVAGALRPGCRTSTSSTSRVTSRDWMRTPPSSPSPNQRPRSVARTRPRTTRSDAATRSSSERSRARSTRPRPRRRASVGRSTRGRPVVAAGRSGAARTRATATTTATSWSTQTHRERRGRGSGSGVTVGVAEVDGHTELAGHLGRHAAP